MGADGIYHSVGAYVENTDYFYSGRYTTASVLLAFKILRTL